MRAFAQLCSIVCLWLVLQPGLLVCQSNIASAAKPAGSGGQPDFSAEPAIIVDRLSVITMHADGTGVRENSLALRVQSEAMLRQFGVVHVLFASTAEHVEFLYARVRRPDGTIIETPVSGALEQPAEVTREAPFYSDLKEKQLPIKSLSVGDILEWKIRILRTVPEAPGQFWGQDTFVRDGVALAETVELHVPVATHVILWTNPETAPPSDTVIGPERVVRWKNSHLEPTAGPAATIAAEAAKKKLLTPEQVLTARKGSLPSIAWTTFPSWEAVGAWYRGLEGDRTRPDATIAAKVAELTQGKTTQTEKAQAIYEFVATQIRYIGVAFGVGRYQPHTAGEVLANQYGDCKDKHTLLAAMLTQLGLQPEAVLVGAGVRFNAAVPSPGSFNHLITQVAVDGKPVWLDTTAEVAPWNTLLPVIRDQQALVVPFSGAAKIEQTPVLPPFPAFAQLVATESLDKDFTSDARITLTFHDDDEITIRSVLRQITPAQYPEFLQRFVAAMGFGGTATEPEISRPDDLDQPLTLSYRYKRVKEADWGANRVTEPFWPISLPGVDEKEPPVAPIELGIPRTETSKVEIKLPQGWSAEIPEAIHAKAGFATADTTFRLAHDVITAERKLTIIETRVPAANWKEYKQWTEAAGVNSFPFLQLIPVSAKALGTPTPDAKALTPPAGKTAEQLIYEAGEVLRTMNTAESTRLLDEAQAINPQQRMLWSGYAGVAYTLGEITKATEDIHKELTLHPDEVQLNGMLAGLQQARGENEAAIASLHRWSIAAPDDPAPSIASMRILHAMKRDSEAIETGTTALAHLSKLDIDLTQFRLTLAGLQQHNGRRADAATTIMPLAKTVTELNQRNSVAYILADAKVDLVADEAMERGVLEKLNAETASWTLDETPQTLGTQTNLLVASWDTMGWILYQEGRLPEARSYLVASWRNTSHPEVLEHLHTVDSALHEPGREEAGSEQSRRTFPLGPAHGHHGTTELRLLLAQGKVIRSEPVIASAIPGVPLTNSTKAAPDLMDAAELVKAADLRPLFPEGSGAHLVRRGIVNCTNTICQLVLEPMR